MAEASGHRRLRRWQRICTALEDISIGVDGTAVGAGMGMMWAESGQEEDGQRGQASKHRLSAAAVHCEAEEIDLKRNFKRRKSSVVKKNGGQNLK